MFLRSAVDQLSGNSASPPLPLPVPLNPPTGATQQSWESQEDNSLRIIPKKFFFQITGQYFGSTVRMVFKLEDSRLEPLLL